MSEISFTIRGIDALQKYFERVTPEFRRIAVRETTVYIVGDDRRGLKHLVPYKYVSRKAAYGKSFFSDKQRRYVMAAIHDGRIVPGRNMRTGALSDAWIFRITGGGFGAIISNANEGTPFVQGDTAQARQPALVGHRKESDVISTNIKGALRASTQAISRYIRQSGK